MTSGAPGSGHVTGGVYKARERIHRVVADTRLLAIPTSCRRVASLQSELGRPFREVEPILKAGLSSDCSLQLDCMKAELLVTARQQ